jgi:hypothetical protein
MLLTSFVLPFRLFAQPMFDPAGIHAERRFSVQAAQTARINQTPQSPTKTYQTPPQASSKTDDKFQEAQLLEAQRRTFAVSIIMSLADEARSHKDLALRARVLAWAADALWDGDPDRARVLLLQAWDAAEKADVIEDRAPLSNATPAMFIALPRRGGGDSRSEVLNVAGRRDRALAEEWLSRLIESAVKGVEQNLGTVNDSWTTSDETSKRLNFAHRLLNENQAEKAFEFAANALNRVNEPAISFLSRLRLVKPELADRQFMLLLGQADKDPTADANTVSGLSSYAFTPGFYVTFARDGGVRWVPALEPIAAPNLPPHVRNSFFRTAGNILMRPSPPPHQDATSAGLIGKYMVVKRLLPLFEQYAPDTALALRSQLIALAEQATKGVAADDDSLLTQGITRVEDPRTVLDGLQERADRATDARERDEIYVEAAALLAAQGEPAAQDIADKIDNAYRREMTQRYVDVSLIRTAIAKRDIESAARFAQAGSLTHSLRAWAYLQISRLLTDTDRTRAFELLEQALAEAQRIDADDHNRAYLIIGVAMQFLPADSVRSWEVAAEAVKAANATEEFSGDNNGLSVALVARSGLKLIDLDTSMLDLATLVRSLAEKDLARANDLAKSFRCEAPRAIATLAVARAAMGKTKRDGVSTTRES